MLNKESGIVRAVQFEYKQSKTELHSTAALACGDVGVYPCCSSAGERKRTISKMQKIIMLL
jgi:hypothetical protein